MAVLKCKMCGGDLELQAGSSVCECEYCGTKQTVPTADSDKKMKLYDRANRLRMSGEFDKAAGVYESIVNEFPEEAEAYWGLVLSKFGIEYVDDPATGDKVPTCHRSGFESVMQDPDFEMVMENADSESRGLYREQAKQIEEIRKGIINISEKEEPYDIFICYKETAEDGNRTIDSVLAQDVYDALSDKGYRVFFSRITLEDKLGQEYEPYIFAALNSAKVMLAFGTSYDYYNAVWVKNEWSRYLKLMGQDKTKHLIPCYKDIDAYDMPQEFAKLQAQDLGKVGATQDLLRGIEKILGTKQSFQSTPTQAGSNEQTLLKRAYILLEDGKWDDAAKLLDQVLNINPENADAYVGQLLMDIQCRTKAEAAKVFAEKDWTGNSNWMRAMQFANSELKTELNTWVESRKIYLEEEKRIEQEKKRKLEEKDKRNSEIKKLKEDIDKNNMDGFLYRLTDSEKAEYQRLKIDIENYQNKSYDAVNHLTEEQLTLERERQTLEMKLSKLGIFQRKEKIAAQERLEVLNTKILDMKNKINEEKEKQRRENASKQQALRHFMEKMLFNKIIMEDEDIKKVAGKLKQSKQGDVVELGIYPQEKNGEKKPIEWLVCEKGNGRVLLISKYVLDEMKYDTDEGKKLTWQNSSLRKFLNNDFLDCAFNEAEKNIILETDVPIVPYKNAVLAHKDYCYYGNSTIDKVFILSNDESERYKVLECKATPYGEERFIMSERGRIIWQRGQFYKHMGNIETYTNEIFPNSYNSKLAGCVQLRPAHFNMGVRPAMWVRYE